jgi:hypothetical protein
MVYFYIGNWGIGDLWNWGVASSQVSKRSSPVFKIQILANMTSTSHPIPNPQFVKKSEASQNTVTISQENEH